MTRHIRAKLRAIAKDGMAWNVGDKTYVELERLTGIRLQKEHGLHEDSSVSALDHKDMDTLIQRCKDLLRGHR